MVHHIASLSLTRRARLKFDAGVASADAMVNLLNELVSTELCEGRSFNRYPTGLRSDHRAARAFTGFRRRYWAWNGLDQVYDWRVDAPLPPLPVVD